jgi:hypothetical protein
MINLKFKLKQYHKLARHGRLSLYEIDALTLIGFPWQVSLDRRWYEWFEQLIQFHKKFGHCNVPLKQRSLARWCIKQRIRKQAGTISIKEIELLDHIGFCWEPRNEKWEKNFSNLRVFYLKYNHCNVPLSVRPLGRWCIKQRYLRQKGCLGNEKIAQLNGIGFNWDPRDERWEKKFDLLKQFKKENGHCNVPRSYGSIGLWCNKQRQWKRENKLSVERIRKLTSMGFFKSERLS